jgi:hypothetical protein
VGIPPYAGTNKRGDTLTTVNTGPVWVLMEGTVEIARFEIFEKTFSTGNTGFQANGSLQIGGIPHNANLLLIKSKQKVAKKAASILGAGRPHATKG